jgi:hypothetical protein
LISLLLRYTFGGGVDLNVTFQTVI